MFTKIKMALSMWLLSIKMAQRERENQLRLELLLKVMLELPGGLVKISKIVSVVPILGGSRPCWRVDKSNTQAHIL